MERLSDTAIEIINELHTERLDYSSEYIPLIDAANRLAAYEDTGLEPQDIISAVDMSKIACALHELNAYKDLGPIDHIRDLIKAEQDGQLVVLDEKTALCMCAGARAIENNKRLFGASYCYDVFGKRGGPKEISYYEASNHLRDVAEPVLDREEAEAALQKGGPHETDPV